jgi:hypothetical protein
MDRFLADLPIFGAFVGTLLLGLGSVEVGYRRAKRRQERRELEKEAPVGAMVGATLGLLAFTFGIAADAFNARKVALVEEANAIRMAYLLSGVIPEAHRAEIRTVLRQYVDERLRWASRQPDEPGASAAELLNRLWKSAAEVKDRFRARLASVGPLASRPHVTAVSDASPHRDRGREPVGSGRPLALPRAVRRHAAPHAPEAGHASHAHA